MHREPDSLLINVPYDPFVAQHALLIPVNVVNGSTPTIDDWVQASLPLQVGYCYSLSRTVKIEPTADYLVVDKRRGIGH
ncbi:hypothetical protein VI817_001839 [Penicillium citrinum]|nr:hypothetical protein VI817_001839 [Penicillium citrinum]